MVENSNIEKYNLLLSVVGFGTWEWDLITSVVVWDDQCHKIFGLELGSFDGTFDFFASCVHPDDLTYVNQQIKNCIDNDEPYFLDFRALHPEGKLVYLNARGTIYKDKNGKAIKILGIIWDVSKDKILQEELLSTTRFKRAVLDSTDYLIISTDVDGTIQTFNKAAENLLGYSAEEMVGKQNPQIFHDLEEVKQYAQELNLTYGWNLEPGLEVFIAKAKYFGIVDIREWTYVSKSGARIDMNLSVTPVKDGEGNIIGYMGIAKDITQDKQKKLEFERSNLELEHFAYITSHDLKEPLRVIASYSQLLEKRIMKHNIEDDSISSYVGFMTSSVKRMQEMISAILAYSRFGRKCNFAPIALNNVFNDVLHDLSKVIIEKNAEIVISDLPEMIVCETEVRQLFQNLISNALKFIDSDKQAKVKIEAKALSDKVWQFSVKDNGIGIEAEHFKRIFLIFQRLHTREEFEGTGIGLAFCKKIVENHNGKIWLESAPGKGTTFFFTLSSMN